MKNKLTALKEAFPEWTDWDGVQYYLGCLLGFFDDSHDDWLKNKHYFWTDNPVGKFLMDILFLFVEYKLLEMNTEMQFRWNKDFDLNSLDYDGEVFRMLDKKKE